MAIVSDSKRRALGKGLDALLPRRQAPAAAPAAAIAVNDAAEAAGGIAIDATAAGRMGEPEQQPGLRLGLAMEIPVEAIERNPWQTRSHFDEALLEELANS